LSDAYGAVQTTLAAALSLLYDAEQAAVLGGSAARWYRISAR
jgi:hypothetical protein